MKEEDLEKIKDEIKDYKPEIVISLWDIALEEIKRRIKIKRVNNSFF